ncbi:MAG TPA: hypothetical protein DDZ51_21180 [Planctomycetaceae bacterium]|nr:hypothetical protein [Planctomycetaceae bacterium]
MMIRFAFAISLLLACIPTAGPVAFAGMITVDFDNPSNWTAGSSVISSYALNHQYVDQGFTFTGGAALRNTTTLQDTVAGALGTHSWRLRDAVGVSWTATYTTIDPNVNQIARLSFDARRWDSSPSPNFVVEYTDDSGDSFNPLITLNNAAFDNSSAWKTFSFDFVTPVLRSDQFAVRFVSAGTTERIMIDNFSVTAVPEPASFVMVALAGIGGFAAKRSKKNRLKSVALHG